MSQIEKNTVSSRNQLKDSDVVFFDHPENPGLRVLFLGNSITLHGLCPSIGWNRVCGMAASSLENDYVHILERRIRENHPDAAFCVTQVAEWETVYASAGAETYAKFENGRAFGADLIIFRALENCPWQDFDHAAFRKSLDELLTYFDPEKKAKIVCTTSFWKHPGDDDIKAYAAEKQYPCTYLGDLGELDEMKAIGLFEHTGVAAHPGDKGMAAIADRIWGLIKND